MLREASVEGYAVDFRRSTRTYYTTGGEASFQFASYSLQGFDSALERHRGKVDVTGVAGELLDGLGRRAAALLRVGLTPPSVRSRTFSRLASRHLRSASRCFSGSL
jgi:hypothetical protein